MFIAGQLRSDRFNFSYKLSAQRSTRISANNETRDIPVPQHFHWWLIDGQHRLAGGHIPHEFLETIKLAASNCCCSAVVLKAIAKVIHDAAFYNRHPDCGDALLQTALPHLGKLISATAIRCGIIKRCQKLIEGTKILRNWLPHDQGKVTAEA